MSGDRGEELSPEQKQSLLSKFTSDILNPNKKKKVVSGGGNGRQDDAAAAADIGVSTVRLPRNKYIPPAMVAPEQNAIGRREDYDLNKGEFAKRRGQ
jgi:hypothetical protein